MRHVICIKAVIFGFCLASLLSACQQTPRHSNTLIFATNTKLGLRVGVDARQVPEALIGYDRQEGVFMPLLANTGGDADALLPCPDDLPKDDGVPANCRYEGRSGNSSDTATDSYSVLATFRGNASGQSGNGNAEVGAAVAQYFATGLAARTLAERAGAAAIATGEAASRSAITAAQIRSGEAATYGTDESSQEIEALIDEPDCAAKYTQWAQSHGYSPTVVLQGAEQADKRGIALAYLRKNCETEES